MTGLRTIDVTLQVRILSPSSSRLVYRGLPWWWAIAATAAVWAYGARFVLRRPSRPPDAGEMQVD